MASGAVTGGIDVVDVRNLLPARRYEKLFTLVHQLSPGMSFVFVDDHDPKQLYYQLVAEYPEQFWWIYLDQGPQVWRIEIGKPVPFATWGKVARLAYALGW